MNDKEDLVRMTVGGVTLDPLTKTPIVVLKDDKDEVTLPIWIGLLEATSMATELEGVKMARPMTHDLLKRVVDELGATVERIVVTELKDNTFYAAIDLHISGRRHTLDSRPSDAISLALRTQSPIFVARAVLEASKASDEAEPETAPPTQDLSEVAPEEWDEILEKLDPSDFKYKM